MKVCTKCRVEKDLSEFYFRKNRNTHRSECKICSGDKVKKWVENNSLYGKNYREEKKGYFREYQRKWGEKNKDRYKEYYNKHKDLRRAYVKDNLVTIDRNVYNIRTCDMEIKPIIEALINLRKKKKILKGMSDGKK